MDREFYENVLKGKQCVLVRNKDKCTESIGWVKTKSDSGLILEYVRDDKFPLQYNLKDRYYAEQYGVKKNVYVEHYTNRNFEIVIVQ